jgi:hypothetical protein
MSDMCILILFCYNFCRQDQFILTLQFEQDLFKTVCWQYQIDCLHIIKENFGMQDAYNTIRNKFQKQRGKGNSHLLK